MLEHEHPLTTEEPSNDVPELFQEQAKHVNEPVDSDSSVAIIHDQPNPNLLTDDSSDEDEDSIDEDLWKTTQANKSIPFTPDMTRRLTRQITKKRNSRNDLLVFKDTPSITQTSDRYVISTTYGAGSQGTEKEEITRRPRSYMVACDFSEESFYAMEWTMGSMLRDGDELHIVSVLNREDNPETVKKQGLSLTSEMKMGAEKIMERAQAVLGQMLLFNVTLTSYAMVGRIKESLYQFIKDNSFTLVICGSRGRNKMKGLFLGSVSSYLLHKSHAPVSVIKKKKSKAQISKSS
ncbi:adenine nucleotide alpha hydrolases-like protein [Hesseltinella vesiculosa]|uniref:Adenine nucleotide alpha hydrolases-like protein n=1 Tax=Hesseltinella vesiculosa TaxID=101127 RepID=A0A1X2GA03_9FUNG|nr:adenine nucleotide alpha hydrolases-like protein [Hesseltinella vesiculosa]